jgi:DNA helicase-2/ATP-dependent DNA helicase PcrA
MSQSLNAWRLDNEFGSEVWTDWYEDDAANEETVEPVEHENLRQLTNGQRAAVDAPDKPVLVLAGAGTGKTKVLVTRISERLRKGDLKPAHVLALTFTKKAAAEMVRRLEKTVGPAARSMDIGTFHSIFAKALRALDGAGDNLSIPADFTLLDETDMKDLLKAAAASVSPAYAEEFGRRCKTGDVLSAFSRYNASLYPDEPDFIPNPDIPSFDVIYRAYNDLKQKNNVLDYDDVLIAFDRLLDIPHIRRIFQMRWRMILVDEYQDTDNAQESILRKLASRHRNITCVGDDDQSIYSWRNAKVSNILSFRKQWPEGEIIRLEENFRSTAEILDCANALIKQNSLRHGKILNSTRGHGKPVTFTTYKTPFDEARAVSQAIARDVRSGIPLNEIAVICRVSAGLQEIQRQLVTDGIRYVMHAGSNVAEKIETKLIAAWIRMTVNPKDESAFMYAFKYEARSIGKVALTQAAEDARVTQSTLEAILRQQYRDRGNAKHQKLFEFLDNVTEVRTLARLGELPHAIVQEIIERSNINKSIDQDLAKAALAKTKDEKASLENKAAARAANLEIMLEHARTVENLLDLAANIILSNEKVADDGLVAWLGTIHAAKSLEWRSVYLTGFEHGIIPSPRHCNDKSSSEYEEERNLGYVAITRARDTLAISWAADRTMYGTSQSGGASEFVQEINTQTCS